MDSVVIHESNADNFQEGDVSFGDIVYFYHDKDDNDKTVGEYYFVVDKNEMKIEDSYLDLEFDHIWLSYIFCDSGDVDDVYQFGEYVFPYLSKNPKFLDPFFDQLNRNKDRINGRVIFHNKVQVSKDGCKTWEESDRVPLGQGCAVKYTQTITV